MIESILPENEAHWLDLRKNDITSTEISALFNCSPYCTKFELWHRKKKNLSSNFEENERSSWGLFLQDGIMAKFAKDNNWGFSRKLNYMRNKELRIGASFDFDLIIKNPNTGEDEYGYGLAEVKNVDGLVFKNGWIVEGDYIEAPAHIELQAQHQMLCSGLPFNYILSLIGGNRGEKLYRTPNQKIFDAIIRESQLFWKSIEDNIEPEPSEVDADFISSLYNVSDSEKILDARGDKTISALAAYYKTCQQEESDAEKRKKMAKAKLLPLIGTASKVLVDGGYSISAGMVAEAEIESYTRKSYRRFSINGKGDKE